MNTSEQIKNRLVKLIQTSEDETMLEIVYQILNNRNTETNQEIQLTRDQEKELTISYEESMDEKHLIDQETLIKMNSKWLEQ